ncbi:MAG: hypothetical protein JW751_25440 [Polyangiaceae bacterium]|nr:hypothetical protein [Polyangiaceae bacterium]
MARTNPVVASVRLTPRQARKLDNLARVQGTTRSAILRASVGAGVDRVASLATPGELRVAATLDPERRTAFLFARADRKLASVPEADVLNALRKVLGDPEATAEDLQAVIAGASPDEALALLAALLGELGLIPAVSTAKPTPTKSSVSLDGAQALTVLEHMLRGALREDDHV